MIADQDYRLEDLAERSGIEPRTIRSWIQQGLLPGPKSLGRNARYGGDTLVRILAIKAMRDFYAMPMHIIRQELLVSEPARIAQYADQAQSGQPLSNLSPRSAGLASSSPPPGTTAADYLKALRAARVFGAGDQDDTALQPSASESHSRPAIVSASSLYAHRPGLERAATRTSDAPLSEKSAADSRSGLARLLRRLEEVFVGRFIPRKAQSEVQIRIGITPEIDILIKGQFSADEIAQFERLADILRELVKGGLI